MKTAIFHLKLTKCWYLYFKKRSIKGYNITKFPIYIYTRTQAMITGDVLTNYHSLQNPTQSKPIFFCFIESSHLVCLQEVCTTIITCIWKQSTKLSHKETECCPDTPAPAARYIILQLIHLIYINLLISHSKLLKATGKIHHILKWNQLKHHIRMAISIFNRGALKPNASSHLASTIDNVRARRKPKARVRITCRLKI